MDEHEMIAPHNKRRLQKTKTRRRLFGKALQEAFLEELASNCNVTQSAKTVGVGHSTVYLKRRKCPEFLAGWMEALEQGYARLEMALVEGAVAGAERPRARGRRKPAVGIEPGIGLQLLREHKRGLAGLTRNTRPITAAPIEEVIVRLEKKLRAYGVRIEGM